MLVVLLISFMMGLLLDIETLLKILKMPVPIFIGLGCQYIIMPLVRLIGAKFTYKKMHFYFIRFDLSYLLVLLVCCSFPMRKDWPYFYTAARQVKIILSIILYRSTMIFIKFILNKGGTNSNNWTILLNGN